MGQCNTSSDVGGEVWVPACGRKVWAPECAGKVCLDHASAAKSPFGVTVEADCLLIRASGDGDTTAIAEALSRGANIDAQLPILMRMEDSDAESVLNRESSDADPARPAARSLTPLMYACDAGHREAVELLLSFDARLDVHDPDGMQALHFAAQSGSAACFRALLEAGANPTVKDDFGCDALDYVPPAVASRGPDKQEWQGLLMDAGGLSLAASPGTGAAKAEDIDRQAVVLPFWLTEAGADMATTSSSLNKLSTVETTLPPLKDSSCVRAAMSLGSSSREEVLSETTTIS